MARKMHPDESRPDDGRDDLSVLHPNRSITVVDPSTGKDVHLVVREYGFEESLELRPLTNLIVDALYRAFQMKEQLSGDEVLDVLGSHAKLVKALVARATDTNEAWLQHLSPLDTENVALTWWGVNRDFFVMRATRRLRHDQAKVTDGPTSTPPSPPTATADPSASGATPDAS